MNLLSRFSPELCGRLCIALVHSLWQVTALTALAWGIARLRRGLSVEWNYTLHVVALLLSCVCVPLTFLFSETAEKPAAVAMRPNTAPRGATEAQPTNLPSDTLTAKPATDPIVAEPLPAGEPIVPVQAEAASGSNWSPIWERSVPWIAGLYVAGVLLMLVRIAVGIGRAERLRARSRPVEDRSLVTALRCLAQAWSLRAAPALAMAEHIVVPKVVGLLKPTILLPTSALSGLSPNELEMILAHELAHVRRYDLWVNLVQRLAEAALFFNPALWLLSRRIGTLREYCCDELACRTSDGRTHQSQLRYAQALLHMVELSRYGSADQPGMAAMAASGRSPSELRRRVARLFGEPVREPLQLSRGGAIAGACALVLLFLGPAIQTAVTDAPGEEDQAAASVELRGPFPDQASAILRDLLRHNRLPFHTDEEIDQISSDFGQQIAAQCRTHGIDVESVSEERRAAILTSLRNRGAQLLRLGAPRDSRGFDRELNGKYLSFPDNLDTLQWKILMALDRGDLTEEEAARQAARLAFLQQQVMQVPETKFTKRRIMLDVVRDWFDDPLQTPIDQPLSTQEMADYEERLRQFITQQTKGARTASRLGAAYYKVMSRMVRFSAEVLWDLKSPTNTVPLVENKLVGLGFSGSTFTLSFAHNRIHAGDLRSLGLVENGSFIFNAAAGEPVGFNVPTAVPAVEKWAAKNQQGDLAFCREGLIGLRGARLLRLDVPNWPAADQLESESLRSMVEERGLPMLSVTENYARYQQRGGVDYPGFYFAILTAEGGLAVAHVSDFSGPDDVTIRVRPRQTTATSVSHAAEDASLATISGKIVLEDGSPATMEGQMYYDVEFPNGNGSAGTDKRYVDEFSLDLGPGTAFLTYYAEGYAPAWTEKIELAPGEQCDDVRLVLKRGVAELVRVTDEGGQPVAGATVVALPEIHGACQGPIFPQTTDENGELLLQHLAKTRYQLKITAPGFQQLRTEPLRVEAGETLRPTMVRSSPAEGIIRFADGTPAPGTKLRVLKEWTDEGKIINYGSDGDGFWGKTLATADARGRFRLDQLADGSEYVFVIEAVDGVRAIIDDLQAGQQNWQLVLPRRKDLVIYVKGDLMDLRKRRGKAYARVRQPVDITRPDGSTYGELIGADVPLDPAEGGGWAIFRGLAVDLREDAPKQQVRVSLGRRNAGDSETKTVDLPTQAGTAVKFELPSAATNEPSPLAIDNHRLKVLVARELTKTNDVSTAKELLPERFIEWSPAAGRTQWLVVKNRPPLFTEHDVASAEVEPNENPGGASNVAITLTASAGERMKRETFKLLGGGADPNLRLVAIVDGNVLTAPRLMSVIGQRMKLTGNFDAEQAKRIVESLSAKPNTNDGQ